MNKNYLAAAAIFACTFASAQAFWTSTNYRGAFPVTDNTAATDWTDGWSNFDPENTSYGSPATTVSSDITTNTTWSGVVLIQNKIYVKNGAVLTIEPGTVIRGDKNSQGSLIITKGSRIMAEGTASNPIIFTSNESIGNRAEGDWGGLVLLGKATNNQPGGVANIEGIIASTDTEFGGSDDNDNSGILRYVRIEFAGIALQPNKEINGLTFGSVGRSTQIDHIQVSFSGDDSYEWFGGTVDARYLIAYRGLDDDFDTDFGFRGRVQFALAIRDKDLSDAAGDSNAFESDNDATGSAATPVTQPVFSNVTLIGPKGNGSVALPTGEKFAKSFRLRRNTALSVFNSVSTGWKQGLSIEGSSTETNFTNDLGHFENNLLVGYSAGSAIVTAPHSFYSTFFGADANDSTATVNQVSWVNAFPALGSKPDARLNTGSPAASGASFADPVFAGGFVEINEQAGDKIVTGLFPNPTNSQFSISFSNTLTGDLNLTITDPFGRTVYMHHIERQSTETSLTISSKDLPEGLYLVTLESTKRKESVKLIVQR